MMISMENRFDCVASLLDFTCAIQIDLCSFAFIESDLYNLLKRKHVLSELTIHIVRPCSY